MTFSEAVQFFLAQALVGVGMAAVVVIVAALYAVVDNWRNRRGDR